MPTACTVSTASWTSSTTPTSWKSCGRTYTAIERHSSGGDPYDTRRMKYADLLRPIVTCATAMLTLTACGTMPAREKPLKEVVPLTAPVMAPGVDANSDKLFVVVTFSGGGKRAAAFSFGVLEALRDIKVTTPDGEQHTMLDEVDLISAVSGGAFTAAYYAMFGRETFDSYAPRFLNHDTEQDLWNKVLKPS